MNGDIVERVGIGLTGVGATNIKAVEAERSLVGQPLTDAAIDEAARLAADGRDPQSDIRGTANYKRQVVRVYVARGLEKARSDEGHRHRQWPERTADVEPRLLLVHFFATSWDCEEHTLAATPQVVASARFSSTACP